MRVSTMTEATATTEGQTEVSRPKPKRDPRPPISNEVLEMIFEEWIAHPAERQVVPYLEHDRMAAKRGWWFSGRRGYGEDLQPLPPELAARLAEREEK